MVDGGLAAVVCEQGAWAITVSCNVGLFIRWPMSLIVSF